MSKVGTKLTSSSKNSDRTPGAKAESRAKNVDGFILIIQKVVDVLKE